VEWTIQLWQNLLRKAPSVQQRKHARSGSRGIGAYLIGFAAMTPFFNVGTLYEGAAAKALGGADISFFIGLPVAGILYYVFTRSVDVAAETRVAQAEAADLERAAEQHAPPG
jgi:purine-cytosine permease-like protein